MKCVGGVVDGTRMRRRYCDSPRPVDGGRKCAGVSEHEEKCGFAVCPGILLFIHFYDMVF